jgi:hypothetical protein
MATWVYKWFDPAHADADDVARTMIIVDTAKLTATLDCRRNSRGNDGRKVRARDPQHSGRAYRCLPRTG